MKEYMGTDMPKDRDADSGKYTETHTDDEILEFLREQGPTGTADVAEEFDYEQPSAYRRLRRLEDDGTVESQKVGNARLWSVSEEN